jgi:hypothetical protein
VAKSVLPGADLRPRLAAGCPARCCDGARERGGQRRRSPSCELMQERGTRMDVPMKPQVVADELNKLHADDAIVLAARRMR